MNREGRWGVYSKSLLGLKNDFTCPTFLSGLLALLFKLVWLLLCTMFVIQDQQVGLECAYCLQRCNKCRLTMKSHKKPLLWHWIGFLVSQVSLNCSSNWIAWSRKISPHKLRTIDSNMINAKFMSCHFPHLSPFFQPDVITCDWISQALLLHFCLPQVIKILNSKGSRTKLTWLSCITHTYILQLLLIFTGFTKK